MRRDLPDQYLTASYAPVCGSGSNERLSVRLSVPSIDSSSGRFAAERPMDRRYRSLAAGAGTQQQMPTASR